MSNSLEEWVGHRNVAHPEGSCECCGATEGVSLEPTRTSYARRDKNAWDFILEQEPEDPNQPVLLCRSCAVDYHQEWDERWVNCGEQLYQVDAVYESLPALSEEVLEIIGPYKSEDFCCA